MEPTPYRIQNIPESDRPRERFLKLGAEAMATHELIAVILGSGMKGTPILQLSQNIIAHFGSLEQLAEATIEELCQVKGLGKVKAIQLKAAMQLGMRAKGAFSPPKTKVKGPKEAYHLIREQLERESREHLLCLVQDAKGSVTRVLTVSVGTLTRSLIHPREVFHSAIRHKAASLILAHNHPSGDPTPSQEDLKVTQRLIEVGKMMGIPVHDHLIVGQNAFVSMREEGLLVFD